MADGPDTTFRVQAIDGSLDPYIDIAGESLLHSDRAVWQRYIDRIGKENVRGVYHRDRLIGGFAFYRMGQWFGGNEIDCAGFSGVAISPADRGSGACKALLAETLRELRGQQMPLASLYASTQHLYRSVGFEQAGTRLHYSLPIHCLTSRDRSLDVTRFDSPPLETLRVVATQRAANSNGNLERSDGLWDRLIRPSDGLKTYTYVFGDLDAPEGYVILKDNTIDRGYPQSLRSTDVAINTPAAAARLLALICDHRSMNDSFEWYGGPNDSLIYFASEHRLTVTEPSRWMLRIVDLPAALSQRGYCRSIASELHLQIDDDLLPENAGRWIVRLSDGKATVERGGEGHVRLNVRSLAPLYSSFYNASELKALGAIESSNCEQMGLANRIFAGPPPWMPDQF